MVRIDRLVVNRKPGSRSTQTISIKKLIKDFGFVVIVPPDKTIDYVYSFIIEKYSKSLDLSTSDVRTIHDF